MFRRRPFRRRPLLRRRPLFRRPPPPPGAPPARSPLPPKAREALARAHRLMAGGQFAEAAAIFGYLSEETKQQGMLIRAADLTLQASRAYFSADDVEAASKHAEEGLRLLVRGGRPGRVPVLLSKMTAALRNKGYSAQADRLEREVEQALEEAGLSLDEAKQRTPEMPEKRGSLPAQCGGCGASLVPDEVEWHDTHTAECLYCGTIVKAT